MPTTRTKAAATDRRSVSHQLREAIGTDDRTAYALGRDAGVDPGVIQRFLNRERGLTLETVDRLALALGLRLVETGRGRGRPAKPAPVREAPKLVHGSPGERSRPDPEMTPPPARPEVADGEASAEDVGDAPDPPGPE